MLYLNSPLQFNCLYLDTIAKERSVDQESGELGHNTSDHTLLGHLQDTWNLL